MTEIFGYPIMGGGGSDLNFKAIAVASESALPSTAAENTIAVITTAPITSYVFSSTAPTSPAEGMVWFATSTASTVGFNAIKRNGLWVYPTGCQQYVSGAWVPKTSKTYQNGAWVDWDIVLYADGKQYVPWTATPYEGTITWGASYVELLNTVTNFCDIATNNTINFAGKSKLRIIAEQVATVGNEYSALSASVSPASGTAAIATWKDLTPGVKTPVEIDVSNLTDGVVLIRTVTLSARVDGVMFI